MKNPVIHILAVICLLISCNDSKQKSDNSTNEETLFVDKGYQATSAYKSNSRIIDSLYYFMDNKIHLSPNWCNEHFDYQLSDIDTVFILKIFHPYDSLTGVISSFNTLESNRPTEYIDLHLFDKNFILKRSLSLQYDIFYDQYDQTYKFDSEVTFQIDIMHSLSFFNDSTVFAYYDLTLKPNLEFDTTFILIDSTADGVSFANRRRNR